MTYREKNIAEVLSMIVDEAWEFFAAGRPSSGSWPCYAKWDWDICV